MEQEDVLVYELDARYFSAGFAGESRPRCILPFTPDGGRRVGDYRQYDANYVRQTRKDHLTPDWAQNHELYTTDVRELDLELVEDKLDRALRTAMIDFLQLDAKPRKAILTLPSMLPTPLLEVALKVLFGHYTQPPSVALLTNPTMCCVSAGLRNALVIDIGWEETVATAVGEYKEVAQRRTIRAAKMLTREMGNAIEAALKSHGKDDADARITFSEAEDVTKRMAWCRRSQLDNDDGAVIQLPIFGTSPLETFPISFSKLAEPTEKCFFSVQSIAKEHDDHDLPLDLLAHRVLLALPLDLRSLCVSRIIVTGGASAIPGLKCRLLEEITQLIKVRGWDPVSNYGTAAHALKERSVNTISRPRAATDASANVPLSPVKMPIQDNVPHADRVHDDIKDPITLKAEREANKGRTAPVKGIVRGVETLGAWVGASLLASLRVKGVHEIEREDFQKHGLRSEAVDV